MKRLLATLTLILCLSFPIHAGHVMGNGRYCPCDDPSSCTSSLTLKANEPTQDGAELDKAPNVPSELGLAFKLLVFWLNLS
jgi:hypothetical protein